MNKQWIYIFLTIIVLLLISFCVISFIPIFNESIEIDGKTFILPNGYHQGIRNDLGAINITNGANSFFIAEYDDSDINKYVHRLDDFIKDTNRSSVISNFTMDDVFVCKLTITDDTNSTYYWFENNGKVFSVYTWDGNPDIENILSDFIKSRK